MKKMHTVFLGIIAIMACLSNTFAQDYAFSGGRITESYGQVNYLQTEGIIITHSINPDSISLSGSLACRTTIDSLTSENHYYRSFKLAEFGITNDYNITLVDIGIQEAVAGSGGVQPITCNLYITDGLSEFPTRFPTSLQLIGTTSLWVWDQAGTHLTIPVAGIAPSGSELVVEIFIPDGQINKNKFFLGINDFGQTGLSYVLAPTCGFSNPIPPPTAPGFPDQNYVMSVIGDTTLAVGIEDNINGPLTFSLEQNYPNPFNPTTTIKYSIPAVANQHSGSLRASLIVYNMLGREIATLVNTEKPSGNYEVKWDAAGQASGVYFYKLTAGSYSLAKKMVLLR